jgi:non-ribosomal peptide synthetase component F
MFYSNELHAMPLSIKISEDEIIVKFDFALTIHHDANNEQLSCTIDGSLDLFDRKTVDKIAQRFHSMLHQLFKATDNQMEKSIYELSLILPDERSLMQSMNNTEMLFPSVSCIHHEFVCQVMKHPQKLIVELDEQSLTYCELLHYAQLLSLNLLNTHGVISGEIVCQCVERSLSMVNYPRKYLFMC